MTTSTPSGKKERISDGITISKAGWDELLSGVAMEACQFAGFDVTPQRLGDQQTTAGQHPILPAGIQ